MQFKTVGWGKTFDSYGKSGDGRMRKDEEVENKVSIVNELLNQQVYDELDSIPGKNKSRRNARKLVIKCTPKHELTNSRCCSIKGRVSER